MKDYLYKLTDILETAARCDRYLPGLKKPTTPRMFDIIETTYNPSEHGYYDKPQLKLIDFWGQIMNETCEKLTCLLFKLA